VGDGFHCDGGRGSCIDRLGGGFNPTAAVSGYVGLAGAAASAAPVVWTKLQPREVLDEKPRIAAGEAMFHQIEETTGSQFRVVS